PGGLTMRNVVCECAVALSILAACSPGAGGSGNGGPPGYNGAPTGTVPTVPTVPGGPTSPVPTGTLDPQHPTITVPTSTADPTKPDAPCKETTQQAEKQEGGKADIIFVLDNSPSMGEEVSAVQANMNTFSQQIEASKIDAHVVVISSPPAPKAGSTGAGQ